MSGHMTQDLLETRKAQAARWFAELQDRILAAFDKQTGEITVLPIASKPGEEARRVLVRGRKGLKRGPVRLLAPLVTHEADGSASPALDAVRRGEGIDW